MDPGGQLETLGVDADGASPLKEDAYDGMWLSECDVH